ncbi:MAG: chorismate-binding protein, partial [Deltaproteobacteria bacterium]|nr:chorismate-binding protein [Deltaproteobacteria bacterium]
CPRFYGGAVGFLGYDMVRYFERLPARAVDDLATDDAVFFITDTMIIFDNVRHTIKVVACAFTGENGSLTPINGISKFTELFPAGKTQGIIPNLLRDVYDDCTKRIDAMFTLLSSPDAGSGDRLPAVAADDEPFMSNMSRDYFEGMVKKAKDYIVEGDIIQVVLSQRFETGNELSPLNLYRALRYVNPSPYLFFLKIREVVLIGSSPEVMVRLEDGTVELRPIAGTRKRGKNEQEDRALADELLQDPKERAEHVMLVDLGRNDLGRIAAMGSVQVTQLMTVERYSHVMHLVSNLRAQLAAGRDGYDVLRATFPAGTLSGAPKIRAMEIIDELEPTRRGPYGGAVGYFSFNGNMDFCITIRT